MSLPRLALLTAVSLAVLAAPAAALDPRGGRSAPFIRGGGIDSPASLNCRTQAYQCGIRAYQRQDLGASVQWFRRAASRGSAPAMRSLGLLYLRGESGLSANAEEALGWFYEAALRNDALSMYALGRAFEEGVGVERDPALARFWIERAADRGYLPARRALAGGQ